jgi:uncharacterized membrane protein
VTVYNELSGRSIERLLVLVDGVFAIVMTLLVLDLRLPETSAGTSHELWSEIVDLGPQFAAYVLSFSMAGTFWLAEHALLAHVRESDRTLAWTVLTFLFFVTTLPFTASTLAAHTHLRLAVWLYWLNLLMLGVALAWQILHLTRAEQIGAGDPGPRLVRRRLVLAQVLYAVGALLVLVDPVAGIIGLAAVQLFFMVSPRLPWAV